MVPTPTALDGTRCRAARRLPAETRDRGAHVKAASLDADGEPGRGLTKARFAGNVDYREKSATVDRDARAARLEVGLKAGFSAFDQAAFLAACGSRIRSSSAPAAVQLRRGHRLARH